MTTTVAVLGLGAMGLPMAENLSRGFTVRGFDITAERLAAAERAGIAPAASAADAVGGAETVEYTGQRQGDLLLTRAASTKPLVSRPAHQKKVGQGHHLLDLLPGHTYPFHEQGRTLQVEDHLDTQLLRLAGQVQPCLRDEEIRIEDVDPIQYVGRQLRSLQFRNGIPCVGENTMLPACGGENVGMERRAPPFS